MCFFFFFFCICWQVCGLPFLERKNSSYSHPALCDHPAFDITVYFLRFNYPKGLTVPAAPLKVERGGIWPRTDHHQLSPTLEPVLLAFPWLLKLSIFLSVYCPFSFLWFCVYLQKWDCPICIICSLFFLWYTQDIPNQCTVSLIQSLIVTYLWLLSGHRASLAQSFSY